MSGERVDGGPAFPQAQSEYFDHPVHGHIRREEVGDEALPGMSLRDYFAAQALVGFLADGSQRKIAAAVEEDANRVLIQDTKALAAIVDEQLADGCYSLADAMLAARAKP